MRYIINLITEARRNPELNPKIGVYDALAKYENDDDVYVSFVENLNQKNKKEKVHVGGAKFGINPQYSYHTPLGIYAYPVQYVLSQYESGSSVPFAGDRPYIWVFKINSKVLNTQDYNEESLEKDILILRKVLEKYKVYDITTDFKEAIRKAYIQTPAGKFWNLSRVVSESIARQLIYNDLVSKWQEKYAGDTREEDDFWNSRDSEPHIEDVDNYVVNIEDKTARIWRKILKEEFGYGGVIDRAGIIHENEPIQGVFFDTQSVRVLELVRNINPREEKLTDLEILSKSEKSFKNALIKKTISNDTILAVLDNQSGYKNHIVKFYDLFPEGVKEKIRQNARPLLRKLSYYNNDFPDFFKKFYKELSDNQLKGLLYDFSTQHLLKYMSELSPDVKSYIINNAYGIYEHVIVSDAFSLEEKTDIVIQAMNAKPYNLSNILFYVVEHNPKVAVSVYKHALSISNSEIDKTYLNPKIEQTKVFEMSKIITALLPAFRKELGAQGVINILTDHGYSGQKYGWVPLYVTFPNLLIAEENILRKTKLPDDVKDWITKRSPGFFEL